MSESQDSFPYPDPAPWGRENWSGATVDEMRDHLERIGPMWGNKHLRASRVIEGFWIAYETLRRVERLLAEKQRLQERIKYLLTTEPSSWEPEVIRWLKEGEQSEKPREN